MILLNSVKIFTVAVLLGCQSCSYWRGQNNAAPALPFVAEELKSEIPFSTKEPDVYQTEIVIIGENGFEEKTFVARNAANHLMIFDFQKNNESSVLQIDGNQTFLIARPKKIYAESSSPNVAAKAETTDSFPTVELLNRKNDAGFENLGAENNFIKYRIESDSAANSESIIFVDEKIGLPVRQEFYSTAGAQRHLTLTVELKNFNTQTDAQLFEIPKDYRKVSVKEFQDIIRSGRNEMK